MAISKLIVGNFKGLHTTREVEIRPITVFVGPNSSGKSSCIHALAALAQTVKITNDERPLVLDDEFAMVHLGRFIEIIHSHSYSDQIELGVGIRNAAFSTFVRSEEKQRRISIERRTADVSASFLFKCTKRTQEVNLRSATYDAGNLKYQARQTSQANYSVSGNSGNSSFKTSAALKSAFFFDQSLTSPRGRDFEEEYFRFMPLSNLQEIVRGELARILYLGPFRQGPLRRYASRGAGPNEVGALGESAITMLANETIRSRKRPHLKQVAKWLRDLGLASAVDVSRIGTSDLFDISMTLSDGKSFPIADLGYGLSQILPVLVQCSFAPKDATLLFEQPEIHLHTISAAKLAKVFIETAKTKGAHVVLETHSPELVHAFMVAQRDEKTINPADLVVYRVDRVDGETRLKPIVFDEEFNVYENWRRGISE